MKTLILNGSPRPQGDTAALIAALRETLAGEVIQIDAYRVQVAPCIDCRRCWDTPGCIFADDFDAILAAIAEADCIILASPVYFSTLPGPLLSLLSRLQIVYTAARHHGKRRITGKKAGGILLCGGGEGDPAPAEAVARGLLRVMHAEPLASVLSPRTDVLPARDDTAALDAARALGEAITARFGEARA